MIYHQQSSEFLTLLLKHLYERLWSIVGEKDQRVSDWFRRLTNTYYPSCTGKAKRARERMLCRNANETPEKDRNRISNEKTLVGVPQTKTTKVLTETLQCGFSYFVPQTKNKNKK